MGSAHQPGRQRNLRRDSCTSDSASIAGFTLMESLVAMVIIGVTVLGLYGSITWAFKSVRLARENFRATQLLIAKMESARLYTFEQLKPGFFPTNFTAPYDPIEKNGPTYNGKITITPATIPVTYASDLKQIKVTVTWDSAGQTRTRELTTFAARSGLQNYIY